jgi:hypothetical protein
MRLVHRGDPDSKIDIYDTPALGDSFGRTRALRAKRMP